MERNYDEIIAEMLIELEQLQRDRIALAERNFKFDKRMELTIRRMVMTEKRLEKIEQRIESSDKRVRSFDVKLQESINELKTFRKTQNEINKYFLKEIRKSNSKK